APLRINGITFDNTAGAFTLAGSSIQMGADINNNSTATQTMSLGVTLTALDSTHNIGGNHLIYTNGSGGLTFSGGITRTATATVSFSGAGTITVSSGLTNNAA